MDDDIEQQIRNIYFEEADINLDELEAVYMAFGENIEKEVIEKSFRLAHNLKGSAKAVGFNNIAEFLHELESFLLKIKSNEIKANQEITNLLLKSNDALKASISELKKNVAFKYDFSELISLIIKESGDKYTPQVKQEAPKQVEMIFFDEEPQVKSEENTNSEKKLEDSSTQINETHSGENKKTEEKYNKPEVLVKPTPVSQEQKKITHDEVLRVPLVKIEKMQDYVGEMVILESMIFEQLKSNNSPIIKKYLRQLDKITKEVQDTVMSLRLVPVKPVFQKLSRTIRDTSSLLKKSIIIEFTGEDTEVDKFILDEISDPLMHMVRNAIDHGIEEKSEDRVLKNKPAEGIIRVKALHEGSFLVVVVSDDGKGLNPEILKEKAIQKGIIKKTDQPTKEQCLGLIFASGFSTKAVATEVSGRGVGMDVVRTNIEKIGGNIQIDSEIDVGTTFNIKIPLSIGILDAFVIEIENERYVVPLSQIRETIKYNTDLVKHVTGIGDVIILRNEEIHLKDLALGFNTKKSTNSINNEKTIIIVEDKNTKYGFIVDRILSIESVVTKTLGEELRIDKGFSGSVILGDGKAVPIIDTLSLIHDKSFIKNFEREKNKVIQ